MDNWKMKFKIFFYGHFQNYEKIKDKFNIVPWKL